MFYEINEQVVEVQSQNINPEKLTIGCVSSEELKNCWKDFGFDEETVLVSQKANPLFRTGVDVHETYTFTELRIVNSDGHEDFVSVYIKNNLLLIVDIIDENGSTIDSFFKARKKYPINKINKEKVLYCFIDSLISDGNMASEELRNKLTEMEESIVKQDADKEFNVELLN